MDAQLEIVTECWVEPQAGIVCNSPHERQLFEGLDYTSLAETVRFNLLNSKTQSESLRIRKDLKEFNRIPCIKKKKKGNISDESLRAQKKLLRMLRIIPCGVDIL